MSNLTNIKGIGNQTASDIEDAGYSSLEELKNEGATVEELVENGVGPTAAQKVIREARQKAVTVQSGGDVFREFQNKKRISTGIPKLDSLLDGGWEPGYVVALGGESGSGKTQMVFQSLSQAVEQTGKPAVYLETERGRYRGDRIRQMGSEDIQQKVYKVGAYDLEQQKSAYQIIMDEFDELSMVAIDSFTSRFRLGQFEDRSDFPARNQEMKVHLNLIEDMAAGMNIPVLATCQVYSNPTQYGSDVAIYGGSLMHHTVNYELLMKGSSGALTTLKIRNHPSLEDQSLDLQINEGGVAHTSEV